MILNQYTISLNFSPLFRINSNPGQNNTSGAPQAFYDNTASEDKQWYENPIAWILGAIALLGGGFAIHRLVRPGEVNNNKVRENNNPVAEALNTRSSDPEIKSDPSPTPSGGSGVPPTDRTPEPVRENCQGVKYKLVRCSNDNQAQKELLEFITKPENNNYLKALAQLIDCEFNDLHTLLLKDLEVSVYLRNQGNVRAQPVFNNHKDASGFEGLTEKGSILSGELQELKNKLSINAKSYPLEEIFQRAKNNLNDQQDFVSFCTDLNKINGQIDRYKEATQESRSRTKVNFKPLRLIGMIHPTDCRLSNDSVDHYCRWRQIEHEKLENEISKFENGLKILEKFSARALNHQDKDLLEGLYYSLNGYKSSYQDEFANKALAISTSQELKLADAQELIRQEAMYLTGRDEDKITELRKSFGLDENKPLSSIILNPLIQFFRKLNKDSLEEFKAQLKDYKEKINEVSVTVEEQLNIPKQDFIDAVAMYANIIDSEDIPSSVKEIHFNGHILNSLEIFKELMSVAGAQRCQDLFEYHIGSLFDYATEAHNNPISKLLQDSISKIDNSNEKSSVALGCKIIEEARKQGYEAALYKVDGPDSVCEAFGIGSDRFPLFPPFNELQIVILKNPKNNTWFLISPRTEEQFIKLNKTLKFHSAKGLSDINEDILNKIRIQGFIEFGKDNKDIVKFLSLFTNYPDAKYCAFQSLDPSKIFNLPKKTKETNSDSIIGGFIYDDTWKDQSPKLPKELNLNRYLEGDNEVDIPSLVYTLKKYGLNALTYNIDTRSLNRSLDLQCSGSDRKGPMSQDVVIFQDEDDKLWLFKTSISPLCKSLNRKINNLDFKKGFIPLDNGGEVIDFIEACLYPIDAQSIHRQRLNELKQYYESIPLDQLINFNEVEEDENWADLPKPEGNS